MPVSDSRSRRARDLWQLLEPIHAVTYFSREPLDALRKAGCRDFWSGYFAGRAAPLGRPSAELVEAVFVTFSREHIARSVPAVWDDLTPADALAARLGGSVSAPRRMIGPPELDPHLGPAGRAAQLALRAARSAPVESRPLFAANLALRPPEDAVAALWHAATLLREHRGDGHFAALTALGLDGREAVVLGAAATGTPREVYARARRFGDEEWAAVSGSLRARGLLDAADALTPAGTRLREQVEDVTDRLAATAYDVLTDAELDELAAALRPIAGAVLASGDIPAKTPIGIDLDRTAELVRRRS